MKGIILAGGTGSRLQPLTHRENKHHLPVFTKRMIEYPLKTLVDLGIRDVVLVTGGQNPGQFFELLKDGSEYGLNRLYYTYQEGSGGLSDALAYARPFIRPHESCTVILGDNYFENVSVSANDFEGCRILLKKTDTPWHFGIAEVDKGRVISIEEKPSKPKSDLAILGLYQFDYTVWDMIDKVELSARGEREITDILEMYMNRSALKYSMYDGYWSDMGTFESWVKVSQRVAEQCI